jgi:uncharacterized protein (DUF2236 family)
VVLAGARSRLNDLVFTRVAGPEGPANRQRIHGTPGARWFGPETAIRQVHADASMYVGGLRALLLQSLHPLAMAAVAGHSGFRGDPWGRLARTSTFLAETTFATAQDAERAVAVVRAVHARVAGTTPDGRAYRADDPHLLRWVHVAEADSFLRAYERYGSQPLSPQRADEYVAQLGTVARRLGARRVPRTRAGLDAALAEYRPELEATPAARDVARFLLLEPPVPLVARVPYAALAGAAVALLPPDARRMLRLPRLPLAEATVVRAGGHAAVGGLRWLAAAG